MVEITQEQVTKLYEFVGKTPPENISQSDISRILVEIEKKFTPYYWKEKQVDDFNFDNNKNILVIDDLEVSLFQLSKLLSKSGYNSYIARSCDEARDIYKKQNFDYVFLDLFIPEPEDGVELLEEFKKAEKSAINKTKIIIISGSDDKKLINECFSKGADDFVSKSEEWHKKLLEKLRSFDKIKRGPSPEIKTDIESEENKIISIKVKNIFKPGVVDDLKREVVNFSLSGYNNVILDLTNVNTSSPDILNVIVYVFKSCHNKDGALKLCNANKSICDALSYVFLDGVIQVFTDKNSALADFYKENKVKN